MSTLRKSFLSTDIYYPESDGQPMADNTLQYEWIVTIKENLDQLITDGFVAADLFWYPVQGNPKIVQAPDVMVALGRAKGHRGSYRQWEEDNIAPQVVFEILSPSNSHIGMLRKLDFYDRYGVQEYYVYDPDRAELFGYLRQEGKLTTISNLSNWISPTLGIRFELQEAGLVIYRPDGKNFLTMSELHLQRDQAQAERDTAQAERDTAQAERDTAQAERDTAQAERDTAQAERDTAQAERDAERQRAEQATEKAAYLAEKLRSLGIDPNTL